MSDVWYWYWPIIWKTREGKHLSLLLWSTPEFSLSAMAELRTLPLATQQASLSKLYYYTITQYFLSPLIGQHFTIRSRSKPFRGFNLSLHHQCHVQDLVNITTSFIFLSHWTVRNSLLILLVLRLVLTSQFMMDKRKQKYTTKSSG